jgi:hypothetical protein
MIPRKLLQEMFENCRKVDTFDINAECRWSYFFTDVDADKLLSAGEELERRGYALIGLLEAEGSPDGDDDQYYYLQVDRVEHHTVDTLSHLNNELDAFASERGLHSYDGMEVGPIEQDESSERERE